MQLMEQQLAVNLKGCMAASPLVGGILKVSFELLEKNIFIGGKQREIYGLSRLHVDPKKTGVGTSLIKWIEKIAIDKFCIVGFCLPKILGFYLKCGWYDVGWYKRWIIVSSKNVGDIVAHEKW